jgi:hypothetical protein
MEQGRSKIQRSWLAAYCTARHFVGVSHFVGVPHGRMGRFGRKNGRAADKDSRADKDSGGRQNIPGSMTGISGQLRRTRSNQAGLPHVQFA